MSYGVLLAKLEITTNDNVQQEMPLQSIQILIQASFPIIMLLKH
jgi:hypothetical protein